MEHNELLYIYVIKTRNVAFKLTFYTLHAGLFILSGLCHCHFGLLTGSHNIHWCRIHGYYLVFHEENWSNAFVDRRLSELFIHWQVLDDFEPSWNLNTSYLYYKGNYSFYINCPFCSRSKLRQFEMLDTTFPLRI